MDWHSKISFLSVEVGPPPAPIERQGYKVLRYLQLVEIKGGFYRDRLISK